MHEQGYKHKAIAKALSVSVRTGYQWLARCRQGGRQALVSRKPPGRKSRLTQQQNQQLVLMLQKTPEENGFAGRYLWTQQLIADLIEREFSIKYHHDRIGRILKTLGFSHQMPARRAHERDEVKIQQWREQTWPQLLKKCREWRSDSDGRRGWLHDEPLCQAGLGSGRQDAGGVFSLLLFFVCLCVCGGG